MGGVFAVEGAAYDDFMGRYSRRLAPAFADFAGVDGGFRVLDVGAGTGALASELHARGCDVVAAEPSPEFVRVLRTRVPEVHETPAEQLPFEDDTFDAALAQLVVAFMADAPTAVREMSRVARVVGLCMWKLDEVDMFAALARTVAAVTPDTPPRVPRRYTTEPELRDLLGEAGLRDVDTAALDVVASYGDYDEFWGALVRGGGPLPDWIESLGDERRDAVRAELHRQLGSPAAGFELRARAYAARGTRS